jgi:hypothetical protein
MDHRTLIGEIMAGSIKRLREVKAMSPQGGLVAAETKPLTAPAEPKPPAASVPAAAAVPAAFPAAPVASAAPAATPKGQNGA